MARPRKNAARAQSSLLPPDEVVEIPVEEQPYPLPKGWKWVRLGSVLSASKEKTEDFSSPSLRYIGLEHFAKDNGIIGFASAEGVRSLKNIFRPGQILYGKLRPYLNKHGIADFDGVCSTDILVFDCLSRANSKFINYFFNLGYFQEYTVANSKGINLPRVSEQIVLSAAFPLPPLDEQQRIVNRIESLFAKLDEAKTKAESVLDGFEIRKAAILHKAFTGGLTGSWSIKNDVSETEHANSHDTQPYPLPKGWKWKILGDVLILQAGRNITAKDIHQERTAEFPYPCYGGNGIRGYVSDYNKDGNFYIIGRQGALCGNIHHASGKFYATEHAVVVEGRFGINIDYAGKYLDFMNLNQYATATAQPGLAVRTIVKLPFLLPTLSDQNSIVSILDNLLAKEQQVNEAAENVLNQIDLMKKAILARAFRGELTR